MAHRESRLLVGARTPSSAERASADEGVRAPRGSCPRSLLSFGLALILPTVVPAAVQAGFAERDVTPAIGSERPGGYGKAFHRKLLDPCKVRAAVFSDGKQTVALVGRDALMIERQVVQAARAEIVRRTRLAAEAILIVAPHSHTSGRTGMVQPLPPLRRPGEPWLFGNVPPQVD